MLELTLATIGQSLFVERMGGIGDLRDIVLDVALSDDMEMFRNVCEIGI